MPIVSQSASASYSLFPPERLLLCAPKIAGLLPAPKGQPLPVPFVYADPGLAGLSEKTRAEFDKLLTTLVEATVGLLADEFSEAEFALASGTFLRQVKGLYHASIIGDPRPSRRPLLLAVSGWTQKSRRCGHNRKCIWPKRVNASTANWLPCAPWSANHDRRPEST